MILWNTAPNTEKNVTEVLLGLSREDTIELKETFIEC